MSGYKMSREVLLSFPFFFACHFSKPLKYVLDLPKWKFSRKKNFTPGKKAGKMTLPPSEKFTCHTPEWCYYFRNICGKSSGLYYLLLRPRTERSKGKVYEYNLLNLSNIIYSIPASVDRFVLFFSLFVLFIVFVCLLGCLFVCFCFCF